MTDDLLIDVLKAAGHADAAALAAKVLEARQPEPAPEPEPERAPEPEPTGPVPTAPSLFGRGNRAGEAAYVRGVMQRDIPRLAQNEAPNLDEAA